MSYCIIIAILESSLFIQTLPSRQCNGAMGTKEGVRPTPTTPKMLVGAIGARKGEIDYCMFLPCNITTLYDIKYVIRDSLPYQRFVTLSKKYL